MVKWKRGDNNNNNMTNTGFRDDDSSSKNCPFNLYIIEKNKTENPFSLQDDE